MRLYQLERYSEFTVDDGEILHTGKEPVYTLDHLDGAYSVCYTEDHKVIHFSASTPVKEVK